MCKMCKYSVAIIAVFHFFSHRVYKTRKQLATIDWNFHGNLPNAKSQSGGEMNTKIQPKDQAVGNKANQSRQRIWLPSNSDGQDS